MGSETRGTDPMYLNPGVYLDGPTAAMDGVQPPPEPKKVLLLTIEVPGVWVDDLDANAAEFFGGDLLDAVTADDGMGLDVHASLTVMVHGDETGPLLWPYAVKVVGAATKDAR